MTQTDPFLERLEIYLDEYEGLTPLPGGIRDGVRAALPSTKQVRPDTGLSRFQTIMNGNARYAAAAAIIALAAIIGFGVYQTQVATPDHSSKPTPSGSEAAQLFAIPADLQGTFLGSGEVGGAGQLVITSDHVTYFDLVAGVEDTTSIANLVGPGRIRLTTAAGSRSCDEGDHGDYRYSTGIRGRLTFRATDVADECGSRAFNIAGEWLRVACKPVSQACLGRLPAGSYATTNFEPRRTGLYAPRFGAMTYEVPDGWANYADDDSLFGLTPEDDWNGFQPDDGAHGGDCYNCPGTRDLIHVLSDPHAARQDCSPEYEPGVGTTAADLRQWLQHHPGLDMRDVRSVTVGGRPAVSMVITARSDWTIDTCRSGIKPANFVAVPVFFREERWHWLLPPITSYGVVLIDIGGGHTVAVMIDTAKEADVDRFMATAMPIIETFDFPEP
jgi:hypothetical protein